MIGIISALEREVTQLKKDSGEMETKMADIGTSNYDFIITGMGKGNVYASLESLLAKDSYDLLICTGFSAGLNMDINPGDLIMASSISHTSDIGNTLQINKELLNDSISILEAEGIDYQIGEIITTDHIADKNEKLNYLNKSPLALDMESYWVAKVAHNIDIPLLIGKAVTDRVDEEVILPFDGTEDNNLCLNIIRRLILHPSEIGILLRLYTTSKIAGRTISKMGTSLIGGLGYG